jgi:hypothetical protein
MLTLSLPTDKLVTLVVATFPARGLETDLFLLMEFADPV